MGRPHPFGKGRGGRASVLASEVAGVLLDEPTSLNRGEELVSAWLGVKCGGKGECGGG